MKKQILIFTMIVGALFTGLTLGQGQPAYADTKSVIQGGACDVNGGTCPKNPGVTISDTITTVINLLSLAAGVAAVIFIIVAGLRYVTSAGSAEATKGAKNTILYAIIGLVIVALAQIIVHFVIYRIDNPSTGNNPANPNAKTCALNPATKTCATR